MALNPNLQYVNTDPPTSQYPYGSARNVVTENDGTGTPLDKNWLNDVWGWLQQLLDAAGITPTNVPDQVGTSQYWEAMRKAGGYPGLVTPFALNADPATLGIRILKLEGQGILVANYGDLVTNTYVGDANNGSANAFYKADDAAGTVRNVAGTYFILADFRGRFVRGIDTGTGVDPTPNRLPGNTQAWAIRRHAHDVGEAPSTKYYAVQVDSTIKQASPFEIAGNDSASGTKTSALSLPLYESDGTTSIPNVNDDETRPNNVAVTWGIWY